MDTNQRPLGGSSFGDATGELVLQLCVLGAYIAPVSIDLQTNEYIASDWRTILNLPSHCAS